MIFASSVLALYLHHFAVPPSSVPRAEVLREKGALTVSVQDADLLTSIPRGAQRIVLLSLELQASCAADVPLTSLDLRRMGLGDRQDIAALYAEMDGNRISNVQSISSRDGRVSLRLRGASIPACESATLSVLADFSASASTGGEHRLVLEALFADATVTVANAVEASPLRRSVGARRQGAVHVEMLQPLSRIRFGNDRMVARFRLSADGEASQRIRSIRFENRGNASDDDLRNFVLVTSRGERISQVTPRMFGNTVQLLLGENFILERGQTVLLELHADVHVGASSSVRFAIENPSDVVAESVSGRRR